MDTFQYTTWTPEEQARRLALLRQFAESLFRNGISFFPLHGYSPETGGCTCTHGCTGRAVGKHPSVHTWQQFITRMPTREEFDEWFERIDKRPCMNLAVVCGRSPLADRWLIVGDDDTEGIVAEYETRRVRTPHGGLHYWWTGDGFPYKNVVKAHKDDLHPLHWRSSGGYVVSPYSVGDCGVMYRWENPDSPITPVPREAVLKYDPAAIFEGERDIRLTLIAGAVCRKSPTKEEAIARLREHDKLHCHPEHGEENCARIAGSIWREEMKQREGYKPKYRSLSPSYVSPDPGRDTRATEYTLKITPLSQIKPAQIDWLWRDHFPWGGVIPICGNDGDGKSSVMADLAARWTTGRRMPFEDEDEPKRPPMDVLHITEEDPDTALRPRLEECGADMDRAQIVEGMIPTIVGTDGEEAKLGAAADPSLLTLPAHWSLIEWAIRARGTRIFVIDPFNDYLTKDVDVNSHTDMRKALRPAIEIAKRHHAVIFIVMYLNKQRGASAADRVQGGRGARSISRAQFFVGPDPDLPDDPDDPDKTVYRTFTQDKRSYGRKAKGLRFHTESGKTYPDIGVVVWDGEGTATANAVVEVPSIPAPIPIKALSEGERSFRRISRAIFESLADGPALASDLQADICGLLHVGSTLYKETRTRLKDRGIVRVYQDSRPGPWKVALTDITFDDSFVPTNEAEPAAKNGQRSNGL